MLSLSTFLRDAEEYRELFEKLSAGVSPIVVSGLSHIHKAHLAAAIRRITTRPVYCVFSDDFAARNAARDIAALAEEEAHIFIAREFTFYNVESASHDWEHERISTLHAMACGRAGLVCTSAAAHSCRTRRNPQNRSIGIFGFQILGESEHARIKRIFKRIFKGGGKVVVVKNAAR